jgi:hypothetical protein
MNLSIYFRLEQRMRWCLLTVICFITSIAQAQVPSIDHLWIDDQTGTLKIIGSFGNDSGNVLIDSVPSTILRWFHDTINCILPEKGRGSCGPVQVINSFGFSNSRLLTAWHLWSCAGMSRANGGGWYDDGLFRLDLLYALKQRKLLSLTSTSHSFQRRINRGGQYTYDSMGRHETRWGGIDTVQGVQYITIDVIKIQADLSQFPFPLDTGYTLPVRIPPAPSVPSWGGFGADEVTSFLPSDSLIRAVQAISKRSS